MCNMTHLYVNEWKDSLLWEEWLIHVCNVTHTFFWRDSFMCMTGPFESSELIRHTKTPLFTSDECNAIVLEAEVGKGSVTHWYLWHGSRLYVWHDSWYGWDDSFIRLSLCLCLYLCLYLCLCLCLYLCVFVSVCCDSLIRDLHIFTSYGILCPINVINTHTYDHTHSHAHTQT